MKAVRVHEHGGPEVLRYEEVPDPRPAAGTAVVEVKASGVNFIDIYHRTGQYPAASLPYVVGTEAAGIVREVGEGVSAVRPGDRVACFAPVGTYAEAIAVPADRLVPVPPQLDLRVAAALLLQGMTAHYLALSTYPLRAGVRCVVHAAAGGVGLLLCQIARRQGAEVIAITSTPEKAELARAAGANQVIGYDGFDLQVRALTAGRGVEVVYDSVGKTTFEASPRCLAPRGMLALYGQASGAVPPLDPQVLARGGLALPDPSGAWALCARSSRVAGPGGRSLPLDPGRESLGADRTRTAAGRGQGSAPAARRPRHHRQGAADPLTRRRGFDSSSV